MQRNGRISIKTFSFVTLLPALFRFHPSKFAMACKTACNLSEKQQPGSHCKGHNGLKLLEITFLRELSLFYSSGGSLEDPTHRLSLFYLPQSSHYMNSLSPTGDENIQRQLLNFKLHEVVDNRGTNKRLTKKLQRKSGGIRRPQGL